MPARLTGCACVANAKPASRIILRITASKSSAHRTVLAVLATLMLTSLVACSTTRTRAPVEDRQVSSNRADKTTPAAKGTGTEATVAEAKPLPGAENAGKPGYYTVKPGDTLIRIALDNGQSWRDIQRWNNLDNPNLIEVGQVLRVVTPGVDASAVNVKPVAGAKVESRPLDARPAAAASSASAASPASAPASTSTSAGVRNDDDDVNWAWPSTGSVTESFDDVKHKGLSFGGKAGDPVLAAADGRVMYAGSGLRGYGKSNS